jgi:hypothetical protein
MASIEQFPNGPTTFPTINALIARLNGKWHRQALRIFMIIVLAHWVEHLMQAFQVYALGWRRTQANGALGMLFPWLVASEWLHYLYAIIMLIGLILLHPAFKGHARLWWTIALAIQVWHHFEHLLLLGQALTHTTLFGAPAPTSILQLLFPRMELHLFYNAVVFVPMLIAMYYHVNPPAGEVLVPICNCTRLHRNVLVHE